MRWLFAALLILVAAIAAQGELITHSVGGGAVSSGVTPLTCASGTTGILYQKSGKVACDSTFTYDGTSAIGLPSTAAFSSTGNITFRAGSTGVFGIMSFTTGGGVGWQFQNPTANLIALTDNTSDIGTTGANRPRDLWLGRNASVIGTITNAGMASDATHTDATVCKDTTSHTFFFGSGAAGICLGTSSIRFKHNVLPLEVGLQELLHLDAVSYHYNEGYGDPSQKLYGFTAEQVSTVLPELVRQDVEGKPQSVDWAGLVPVLVRAIQQQQVEIEDLKRRIR
jgi:hypothetical protein